jgi:hypothetical protein
MKFPKNTKKQGKNMCFYIKKRPKNYKNPIKNRGKTGVFDGNY